LICFEHQLSHVFNHKTICLGPFRRCRFRVSYFGSSTLRCTSLELKWLDVSMRTIDHVKCRKNNVELSWYLSSFFTPRFRITNMQTFDVVPRSFRCLLLYAKHYYIINCCIKKSPVHTNHTVQIARFQLYQFHYFFNSILSIHFKS